MRLISATTLLFFVIYCAKVQVNASGDWCYEDPECGPSHWAGTCKSGKSQSPIDLNGTLGSVRGPSQRLRFDSDYFKEHPKFYVTNNGHTVQVQLEREAKSTLLFDAEGLRGSYIFAQAHFHWGSRDSVGSEHTIDGKHYPMELHLVHYLDRYDSLTAALQDNNRRALAVLGVFFNVTENDNPAMQSIIEAIPQVSEPSSNLVTFQGPLNLTNLLPRPLNLFRYEGSLTTPTCAEKVVWTVFQTPIGISEKQLNVFRSVKDGHGKPLVDNYRPVQAIARRVIKFYNVDSLQLKTDDESSNNEIEDFDPTTEGDDRHGIDHEPDEDHELTNQVGSGSKDKSANNKNASAVPRDPSLLICFVILCSFFQFNLQKVL